MTDLLHKSNHVNVNPNVLVSSVAWLLITFLSAAALAKENSRDGHVFSSIQAVLTNHCVECHHGDSPEAGIDLSKNNHELKQLQHTELLAKVHSVVKRGKMPPRDAEPLLPHQRSELLTALLLEFDRRAVVSPSKVEVARRLTNIEYQNTLSDLLGFEVNVIEHLPKDPIAPYQFNNTAEFMQLGPEQIDRYIKTARKVLASAIVNPEVPEVYKTRVEWQPHGADRGLGADEVGVWGNRRNTPATGMGLRGFPKTGEFAIRIQASAILPPGTKEVPLRLVMGYTLNVNSSTQRVEPVGMVYLTNTLDNPQVFEFRGRIENFPAEPGRVINGQPRPDSMTVTFQNLYDDGTLNDDAAFLSPRNISMPRVVINWAEFESPIVDVWPPEHHTRILFESLLRESNPQAYVRQVLSRFMTRAFRRPVTNSEIDRFAGIYEIVRTQLPTLEAAMREALAMVLVSPQFLYMSKSGDAANRQFELAERLSYFLWGSMPDDTLASLALESKLDSDEEIETQVLRMLADPRTEQSFRNFTMQWLSLQKLSTVPINRDLFPRFLYYVARGERAGTEVPYRPTIRDYMVDESVAFLQELIRSNESVLNIVDSRFAMLNQPLSVHYGVRGIQSHELRRVELPAESRLGGMLSQGSVLIANSTGSAPHPIYRAVWLREAILGDEVPAPPADVPALSDTAGESADSALTIGRLLQLHRKKESCRGCHANLDPWGIPFEQYNSIGRFQPMVPKEGQRVALYSTRTHGDWAGYQEYLESINTESVSAAAVLPNGTAINGLAQLKRHLIEEYPELIAENLIRKLLSYGLGRKLDWRDTAEVEKLVNTAAIRDYRMKDIIVLICQSELFRQVENSPEE